MQHLVKISLSTKAQAKALRNGEPAQRDQDFVVPSDRKDLLAKLLDAGVTPQSDGSLIVWTQTCRTTYRDGRAYYYDTDIRADVDSRPATIEEAVDVACSLLRACEEAYKQDEAEKIRKSETEAITWIEKVTANPHNAVEYNFRSKAFVASYPDVRIKEPALRDRFAGAIEEAKKLAAKRSADERARGEREDAEKAAAAAAAEAERLEWIKAHGSPRLKALVEEGIGHTGAYKDERLAHDRPGWKLYATECGSAKDRTNAELAEIEAMRRERAAGVSDVQIQWLAVGDNHNEDCDGECGAKSRAVLYCEHLDMGLIKEI